MRLIEMYAIGLVPIILILGAGYLLERWMFGKEDAHHMIKMTYGTSLFLGGTLVLVVVMGCLLILALPLLFGAGMMGKLN